MIPTLIRVPAVPLNANDCGWPVVEELMLTPVPSIEMAGVTETLTDNEPVCPPAGTSWTA